MKIAVFSTKPFDQTHFMAYADQYPSFEWSWFETRLNAVTAPLAMEHEVVCAFVNDELDAPVLQKLWDQGSRLIALRCAGFNNTDLVEAERLGFQVCRVPAYSPYAVAEHAIALIMTTNRNMIRANARVRDGNFTLNGLVGFDLHGKTVGVIGTGIIGQVFANIIQGFGTRVLAYDPYPNADLEKAGIEYVNMDSLCQASDIISLHCPLTPENHHLIDYERIKTMKKGVTIINTSRGGLIDTGALIRGLKKGRVGHVGLDVYEEEENLFFEDHSDTFIQDDVFARLLTFPNVMITGHQAYLTREALERISEVTLENIQAYQTTGTATNLVTLEKK